jgi:phosphate transport system substrate-binding protein
VAIEVVHRSDGSGTSFVFTDYLSKVSPEWKAGPGAGAAVNWPVGLGGKGSEGLTGLVKQTPNSIGYTEMIYALQNKITMGLVQNGAGKFLKSRCRKISAFPSPMLQARVRTRFRPSLGC